ncbi:MAG: peroxiredoxin [Steroidobacteraceae bacterium]
MLKPGSSAPAFTLPDQDGTPVTLSALLQTGPLILYFYPADFTPGCTREACSIRDLHEQILATGLQVVGVSPQSPDSHRQFRERYALPFRLLSDVDKVAIKAFDVNGPLGFGVRRATFLIGSDGKIESAVLADLKIAEHEQFIRAALRQR